MSNLKSALSALNQPARPGALKSVFAGLAIAWGTRTFSNQAMEAAEQRDAALAELDALRQEIESVNAALSERLLSAIRDGYADPAVKARAAYLGWAETPSPFAEDTSLTENDKMNILRETYPGVYPTSIVDPLNLQDAIDANRDASD
jgi:hypothetical protein